MQTELKQFGFLFANRKLQKCKFGVKHFTVQTSVKYDSLLKPHTNRTELKQFGFLLANPNCTNAYSVKTILPFEHQQYMIPSLKSPY